MTGLLDGLHLGRAQVIGAGLVDGGPGRLALVDCGPDTCFPGLVAGLRALGRGPQEVSHLLVTHIHLDHSGGAWRWAREFGTTVCVHPRGAPHLLAPEKLVASASRIFGADMDRLWGRIEAVPPDRLQVVPDGGIVEVGTARLQALDTPGHAQHHHAWWLPAERVLFGGDVAGVCIGGGPQLPPCPPPDIEVEAWQASLARIRALAPERIVLPHFGDLDRPLPRLDELERRLLAWAEWVRVRAEAGRTEAEIIPEFCAHVQAELRAAGVDAAGCAAYEQADPAAMSVGGLLRYWKRRSAPPAQRP